MIDAENFKRIKKRIKRLVKEGKIATEKKPVPPKAA
jgi:hypothetical protein